MSALVMGEGESPAQDLSVVDRKIAYYLVPVDEQGNMQDAKAIPVMEAEQLNRVLLPVEPLYTYDVAAALVPMHKKTFERFLHKHRDKFIGKYRWVRKGTRLYRQRLFSATDVRLMRSMTVANWRYRKKTA